VEIGLAAGVAGGVVQGLGLGQGLGGLGQVGGVGAVGVVLREAVAGAGEVHERQVAHRVGPAHGVDREVQGRGGLFGITECRQGLADAAVVQGDGEQVANLLLVGQRRPRPVEHRAPLGVGAGLVQQQLAVVIAAQAQQRW